MKKALGSKLADEIPHRIVDESAETIRELILSTGQSEKYLQELANARVSAGLWERVWKKSGKNIVPAYRRKAPTRIDSEVTMAK